MTDFQAGFINLGLTEIRGIQSVFSWQTSLGNLGRLNLNLNYFHTEENYQIPGSGNRVDSAGRIGNADNRATLSAIWTYDDFRWFNQLRWIDASAFSVNDGDLVREPYGVGSWAVVNSTVSYSVNENIDLRFTVENLFDREAPYPAWALSFNQGVRTYWPGILGRYGTFTVQARFF